MRDGLGVTLMLQLPKPSNVERLKLSEPLAPLSRALCVRLITTAARRPARAEPVKEAIVTTERDWAGAILDPVVINRQRAIIEITR
jgi:hypothetical protein